ncbi:hypothetical protein SDJN02_03029, partial [Cucurbita argyrosperma subsp. argyrosperma]
MIKINSDLRKKEKEKEKRSIVTSEKGKGGSGIQGQGLDTSLSSVHVSGAIHSVSLTKPRSMLYSRHFPQGIQVVPFQLYLQLEIPSKMVYFQSDLECKQLHLDVVGLISVRFGV